MRHGRSESRSPSPRSARAWARSATSPTSRRRWSPSSRSASASRSWSRARPASARPSWPRRSRAHTGRKLIRLQCYEGLDEAKALYEWNYRKQLLRIQAEAGPARAEERAWEEARGDIFSEEFMLTRPLLEAISTEEPVVLLIDEIDKTDQEFEAMLLEVLSDFQISIPELGVIEATHDAARGPAHLQQLARADRGAEAPLPLPLARLPLRRARARDRPPAHARAGRGRRAAAGRDRPDGPRARPEEAALDRRVDRLGPDAAADRRRRHRPRDLRAAR